MLFVCEGAGGADERAFATLRQIRDEHRDAMSLAEFKGTVREQFWMLSLDQKAALAAIPVMARRDPTRIADVVTSLRRVATAAGPVSHEVEDRLARVERLFEAALPMASEQAAALDRIATEPPTRFGKRARRAGREA
jgi:hypothetical protein